MQLASLGSGSKGNCTLVRSGETMVMVDCGFSARQVERRLRAIDLMPEQITAILVTHEHGDHIRGVGSLSRKYGIPVLMSHGTACTDSGRSIEQRSCFNCHESFDIGNITIFPVPVPHDAREPVQYRFESYGARVGVLTDLGHISEHVVEEYGSCDALLLECNHDLDLLAEGPYPQWLKERVGGNWGHLNNHQSASLLERVDHRRLQHLVIAHVSEQNNRDTLAMEVVESVFSARDRITLADQQTGFGWLDVTN